MSTPWKSRGADRQISLKKANAEAQRRAMNERRSEYSNRIRKDKRSHLVTLKRLYVQPPAPVHDVVSSHSSRLQDVPADPTVAAVNVKLADLAWAYIRSKDVPSLSALQSVLARNQSDGNSLLLEQNSNPNEDHLSLKLANTLAYSLSSPNSADDMRLLASRVLTNLAATERTDKDETNYYGPQLGGWCDILIRSQALPSLVQVLTSFGTVDLNFLSSQSMMLELCQQCCWAVGNLAGDSQSARDAAQQAGVVAPLVTALHRGLELEQTSICRNAAWALSNLARGVTTSGHAFISPSLLTPVLIAQVLMSPEQKGTTLASTSVTWWDVANEMCWILAFLTAREDETVDYLCAPAPSSFSLQPLSGVCESLAYRLDNATRVIRGANSLEEVALQALRMSIPCIRAIGNIATACQGRHVPSLLHAHNGSIVESLSTLVEAGSFPSNGTHGDLLSVSVEATWAVGALLCDAGLPGHPSTTVACPLLLPVLCQTLSSSGFARLELKREAVTSLWNTVAAPPIMADDGHAWSSRPLRDTFLVQISETPGIIAALTELMISVDADASFASIKLLNSILRRLEYRPAIRMAFLECNGVEALEAICDRASQAMSYGGGEAWLRSSEGDNETADIAADLIDDLFGDHIDDREEMAIPLSSQGQQRHATFSFTMPESKQVFDFDQPPPETSAFPEVRAVVGTGRGRGKTLPAWMQQA